jgi:iron complex outermembrane receptor protein
VTRSDDPGRDAQRSNGLATRVTFTGFRGLELRSVTTWADSDIHYSFDGDWGNDRDWGLFAPYDFTQRFQRDRRTVSEDLRLTAGSWLVGAYVLDTRETNDQLDEFNGAIFRELASRYDATNAALYGELDVPVGDRARLSIGARVERRDTRYVDSDGRDQDPSETMAGGHVALEYDLAPGRMLYATLARGYKAGGFNIVADVPADRATFDAEFLSNVEAGFKGELLDGRVHGELAAFYMRRADQQVATSTQLDPGDPLSFVFFTDNAARGKNYGLEASAAWRATPRFELSATAALLRTRYLGYRFGERNLDGRAQAHAPAYQLALGAQYRHPLGPFVRVDAQSVDGFYFDASHDERAPAFELVHARVGYESERWSVSAWARNLFDEDYAMRGFFFGNEPPDFIAKRYVQPGDPRQLGVTFTWTFE